MMMMMMTGYMRRYLSDTQLSGTLPPSVGNLTALNYMCGRLLSSAVTVWRAVQWLHCLHTPQLHPLWLLRSH